MDDAIRDIAQSHGHEDLSDETVHEVKRKLSESYIDSILDTGTELGHPIDSGTTDETQGDL